MQDLQGQPVEIYSIKDGFVVDWGFHGEVEFYPDTDSLIRAMKEQSRFKTRLRVQKEGA